MKKYILTGLSVAGGTLSGLAWSGWCSGLILLISLVPFFIIENHLYVNRKSYSSNAFFIYLLPGFLIFSMLTLGWLRIASIVASVTVILGITFLMAFTGWLAHLVRLRKGNKLAVAALIAFWLSYEFLTLNADIITPWADLGNGLAKDIRFIQWYEVTGVAGGTLWILVSNILLSVILIRYESGVSRQKWLIIGWLITILIPSIISMARYYTIKPASVNQSEIVIVQPNFDPYTTKFTLPFERQLNKVISMAEPLISDNTSWIITPETTVDDPVNEEKTEKNIYIRMVMELAKRNPDAVIVTGMTTYKIYPPSEENPSNSARFLDSLNRYYDHFNSALKIDTSGVSGIYHKSKLVPGIEKQFSTGPGKLLSRILPYLGGSQWGYGTQKERSVFTGSDSETRVAPVICYESVFGRYVANYVKNGANLIFIITNDGWWKNTDGYDQHLTFAYLRAIETRRPVARCGNTGISALIDFRGRVISRTGWWTSETLKGNLTPETRITLYVRYGDVIFETGTISAIIIFIIAFLRIPFRKKSEK
jgi:apolipoprotein N-acyltransferase